MKTRIEDFTEVEKTYCEHCDEQGKVSIYYDNDNKQYIILHDDCRAELEAQGADFKFIEEINELVEKDYTEKKTDYSHLYSVNQDDKLFI